MREFLFKLVTDQRFIFFILAPLLILACVAGFALLNNTPTVKTSHPTHKVTPTKPKVWTSVYTFYGQGSKASQLYNVDGNWRISWVCNPDSFDGYKFQLLVSVRRPDNIDGDFAVINTVCTSSNTSDVSYDYLSGDVFLDVTSEGSWKLDVQELK